MGPKKLLLSLQICLLFFIRTAGWCADNPFAGKKACVLPFMDLTPEKGDQDRKTAFFNAVHSEIQAAGFELLPQERISEAAKKLSLSPADFNEGRAAVSVGSECGADLAVSGFFSLEGDRILASVSCYDVNGRALAGGFMRSWRFNLGIYTSLHSEMAGFLPRVKLTAPAGKAAASQAAVLSQVTFTCPQDGMEVGFAGETGAGRIEGGKLSLETAGMQAGSTLLVEKKMGGFHTAWQTVKVGTEIPLTPLRPRSTYAVEANWTGGQLLGLGAAFRYYTIPDSFFFAVSFYPYAQYPSNTGANAALHFDLALQAGGYVLGAPDSMFRLGVSTGLGTIVSAVLYSEPIYADWYLNVANLWIELNLPRIAFFLRPELKYTLGSGVNALGKDILHYDYGIPITLGALFRW